MAQRKGQKRKGSADETVMTPFWIIFALAAAAALYLMMRLMFESMFRGKVM